MIPDHCRAEVMLGVNNNVAPGDTGLLRLTSTGAVTITGFTSGQDGRILKVYWDNAVFALTINHEDANSSASNRIITNTGLAVVSVLVGTFEFTYSASKSRWILTGFLA